MGRQHNVSPLKLYIFTTMKTHCIVVCVRECVSLSMVCPSMYIIADTPQIYLKDTTSKHYII